MDRIEPVKFCHLPKTYVEVIRMTYGRKSAIVRQLSTAREGWGRYMWVLACADRVCRVVCVCVCVYVQCGKLPEEPALCLLCGCVVAVNLREHDQRRFEEAREMDKWMDSRMDGWMGMASFGWSVCLSCAVCDVRVSAPATRGHAATARASSSSHTRHSCCSLTRPSNDTTHTLPVCMGRCLPLCLCLCVSLCVCVCVKECVY